MYNLLRESRNTSVLIFGLDTGRLEKEFCIGDLKVIPNFDIEKYLEGYDEHDVGFIIDNAKYGQYRPTSNSMSLSFSPVVDDLCLIPFRLFKPGWLSAMPIAPITKTDGIETRCELDITRHLFGQIWADRMTYTIDKKEINLIQQKYQKLLSLPKGYLEMALRRFSRCYKYIMHNEYAGSSELDDYWIDLIIVLESITSKNERGLTANMARRTAILLGRDQVEQRRIDNQVRKMYKQRCSIVHGEEKDIISDATHEYRFMEAESLRSLIRDTINASINLLIDPSISLTNSAGRRKNLPEIIDEKCRSFY